MKKEIDCILVVPDFTDKNQKHKFSNMEMLGPEYIAASVEYHGYRVELLNAYSNNITMHEIYDQVISYAPYLLGVTCASQRSYPFVKDFICTIRRKGYRGKIVVGGFYATLEPEKILNDIREIDAISLGEGEFVFVQILESIIKYGKIPDIEGVAFLKDEKIIIYPHKRLSNLDFPFFPKRFPLVQNAVSNMVDGHYIKGKYYNMVAGRGCYGRCSFCSIHKSEDRTYRVYRSVNNVIDEMEELKSKYQIQHIWFNDEIFYDRSKKGILWMNEFCEELARRKLNLSFNIEMRPNDINEEELMKLKSAGLTAIFVGIESGIQRILDEMRKDTTVEQNVTAINILKKLDIKLEMGWISLIPTMSFEELIENYRFLFATDCYTEENIYNRFNLYGGCYYEEILGRKGLLKKDNFFYDRFGYTFADRRVGCAAQIIDELRGAYLSVKKKTASIQQRIAQDGEYEEYLSIRKIQREIWTWCIPQIIEYISMNEISLPADFFASEIYKKFEKLIKNLEESIDCHEYSVWQNGIRTMVS